MRRHHRGVQFGSNNGQGLGHVEADVGHHITGHVQNWKINVNVDGQIIHGNYLCMKLENFQNKKTNTICLNTYVHVKSIHFLVWMHWQTEFACMNYLEIFFGKITKQIFCHSLSLQVSLHWCNKNNLRCYQKEKDLELQITLRQKKNWSALDMQP